MIYQIATIVNSQIQTLKLASGENLPEGVQENGATIVYIDFPIEDNVQFIKTHYWDGEWKERSEPPNRHAYWTGSDWEWSFDDLLEDVRKVRNRLLSSSDWTQLQDSPLSEDQKEEWQLYRMVLRDLDFVATDISSVSDVVWPDKP